MPSMATAAAVADEPAVVELRTCRKCDERKPLDQFVKTGKGYRLHTCKTCRNAQRAAQGRRRRAAGEVLSSSTEREARARMRAAFGHRHVEEAPNPAPARLLVDLLRDSRRVGMSFAEAWSEDVEFVLARIRSRSPGAERESWREAFESTRANWEASYNRVKAPDTGLDVGMVAEPSGDRSDLVMLG